MRPESKADRSISITIQDSCIIFFFGLMAALACLALRPALVDDAFIYLRVAENLASGTGMVYNAGEYSNAVTSPIYTLILAALCRIAGAGPHNLLAAYFIGMAGIPIVLYLVFRKESRILAILISLAVMSDAVLLKSVGLETSCFLFTVLAAAYAFQSKRYVACGFLCGLAGLMRTEGVALIVVICLINLLIHRRMAWASLFLFIAIITPWAIFSLCYFNTLIPNSVIIKTTQSEMLSYDSNIVWLFEFLKQSGFPWLTLPLSIIGLICIGRDLFRGREFGAVVVAFTLIQISVYSVMDAPVYYWYFALGNMAINICIVIAVYRVIGFGMRLWSQRSSFEAGLKKKRFDLIPSTIIVAFCIIISGASPLSWPSPYRLADDYREVGTWIADHTDLSAEVACVEIGYIGYYSQRPVCDMAGLLHKEAVDHLRAGDSAWWLTAHTPEVVVMHVPPWLGEPSPKRWKTSLMHRFRDDYRLVKCFDSILVLSKQQAVESIAGRVSNETSSLDKSANTTQ